MRGPWLALGRDELELEPGSGSGLTALLVRSGMTGRIPVPAVERERDPPLREEEGNDLGIDAGFGTRDVIVLAEREEDAEEEVEGEEDEEDARGVEDCGGRRAALEVVAVEPYSAESKVGAGSRSRPSVGVADELGGKASGFGLYGGMGAGTLYDI